MSVVFQESVLSAKTKRVIRGLLLQGKEDATQLKFLLQNQNPINADGSSPSAKELVANVLRSITDTLYVMTSSEAVSGDDVAQNVVINSGEDGSQVAAYSNDLRSEDSSESRKGVLLPMSYSNDLRSEDSRESRKGVLLPVSKDRRGSYKRRKTEQTHTVVSQTTDDNHAWRKYGQKEILNSQFPRSYFRCTRKFDQGCRATKQVQRSQENPNMYQITYIGFHTCKAILEAPQMVTYSDTNWNSFLVNSQPDDHSKVSNEQDPPINTQSPTVKQEYPNDISTPSDLTDNLDPYLWSDLKDFEVLSKPPADTGYSCTESQNLEIDFGIFSSDFDFHLDDSRLL